MININKSTNAIEVIDSRKTVRSDQLKGHCLPS